MALLHHQIASPSLSSLHSLSFSNSKPLSSNKFSYFLSSKPKPFNHLNRITQNLQFFKQPSTSHTEHSSGSIVAAAAPTEAAEGLKESVVEVYDRRRLIAQNIPWDCTAEDIKALFEKHGTVADVELSMYNKTKNRGLAFITMASEEEATVSLNNLDSYDLDGRIMKVAYARASKKNPPPEADLSTKKYNVYVGNLAWRVRSQDLRDLFNANGRIISIEIVYQSKPRRPAGYGFVSFASKEEAEAAISTLNGKAFMGRTLRLGLSKLQPEGTEVISNEVEESRKASNEVNTDAELSI